MYYILYTHIFFPSLYVILPEGRGIVCSRINDVFWLDHKNWFAPWTSRGYGLNDLRWQPVRPELLVLERPKIFFLYIIINNQHRWSCTLYNLYMYNNNNNSPCIGRVVFLRRCLALCELVGGLRPSRTVYGALCAFRINSTRSTDSFREMIILSRKPQRLLCV